MDGEQELGILVVGVLKVLCNLYNQTAKLSKCSPAPKMGGGGGGGYQTIVWNFPEKLCDISQGGPTSRPYPAPTTFKSLVVISTTCNKGRRKIAFLRSV